MRINEIISSNKKEHAEKLIENFLTVDQKKVNNKFKQNLFKSLVIPKSYQNTMLRYIELIKEQPNEDKLLLAAKASNEIGHISSREFLIFLKDQKKKNKLPSILLN